MNRKLATVALSAVLAVTGSFATATPASAAARPTGKVVKTGVTSVVKTAKKGVVKTKVTRKSTRNVVKTGTLRSQRNVVKTAYVRSF